MKIISLIASGTEIVWALGHGKSMVGRSHECDYPGVISSLPQVTWTKFATDRRSYEIDQQVKAIVQEGLSVYGVDADILQELQPDVIITQDHCHVCAVSLKDVEAAVCKIIDSHPAVVSLHPDSLSDIWRDIRSVANALGDPESAENLINNLHRRLENIRSTTLTLETRPRVVFIEWIEPLMAGGNWVPELLEIAGGQSLLGKAGKHSPQMDFRALVEAQPEVIIIAPCGFTIERTLEEISSLTDHPEWQSLPATKNDQVYITDGNEFFNRPGPRIVESVEICAEIIHPQAFDFDHRRKNWIRLES